MHIYNTNCLIIGKRFAYNSLTPYVEKYYFKTPQFIYVQRFVDVNEFVFVCRLLGQENVIKIS